MNSFEKSKVKKWTKNPNWDQWFVFDVRNKSTKITFTLWDYDAVGRGPHDYLGNAECDFHDLQNDVEKHFELPIQPKGTLYIALCIKMNPQVAIPLTPQWQTRLENKKVTPEEKRTLELPGGILDEKRNPSPDLEAFIKAVWRADIGEEIDTRVIQFVTNYMVYHMTFDESLPLPSDFSNNKQYYKTEAIKRIKALFDNTLLDSA